MLRASLIYSFLFLILLWLGFRWFERANLYIPSRSMGAHPGSYGLAYEDIMLQTADMVQINAWFIPNQSTSPTIIICHGNAGNISHRLEKILIFRKAGASVLVFDYRGYGRSEGSPTEQGTYLDAEAAYRWLMETKKTPPKRVFFYGESLGAGIAVEMATRREIGGLIIDSAFTSTIDMGKLLFPWLPVRHLVRFHYDNLKKIPKVQCPVLVMHSPADDIIPYEMGQTLFKAANSPKTFFEMRGDHNEGFLTTGVPYGQAIERFLKMAIMGRSQR